MVTGAAPGWGELRDSISGEVVLPGSSTYHTVRKSAIANFHGSHPRAVVRCQTPEDVSQTVSFARRHGLHVVPRSGGPLLRRTLLDPGDRRRRLADGFRVRPRQCC